VLQKEKEINGQASQEKVQQGQEGGGGCQWLLLFI